MLSVTEIKKGGIITCITFTTIIAHMLKIDTLGYLMIPRSSYFNLKSLMECGFIRKVLGNGLLDPDVYF
jgi:hypothetical protein